MSFLPYLGRIPSKYTIVVVFSTAILIFLLDYKKLRRKGHIKELRTITVMACGYLILGLVLSIVSIFI